MLKLGFLWSDSRVLFFSGLLILFAMHFFNFLSLMGFFFVFFIYIWWYFNEFSLFLKFSGVKKWVVLCLFVD